MRILMSGSHGLIGSALFAKLEARGDEVTRLVRTTARSDEVFWDLEKFGFDRRAFEGFDAFIHLAGVNIGEKRLTERRKRAIWDSRLITTEFLCKIIDDLEQPPGTFVCASAVGFYGSRGNDILTEESPVGLGYFASLCDAWEATAQDAAQHGVRVANIRSGVIIDKDGGALQRQLPLFKLMLGGPLGNGRQWLSWIALEDEVNAILHILDNESLSGPVNLTAPNPVTNAQYTFALSAVLNRLAVIPTPAWTLRLALGTDLTEELLLTSQRVIPEKLEASGFEFRLPAIEEALEYTILGPQDLFGL